MIQLIVRCNNDDDDDDDDNVTLPAGAILSSRRIRYRLHDANTYLLNRKSSHKEVFHKTRFLREDKCHISFNQDGDTLLISDRIMLTYIVYDKRYFRNKTAL